MLTKPRLAFHDAAVQISFRLDGARAITLDVNSFAMGRIIAVTVTSTSFKLSRSLAGGDKMEVLDTMPLPNEPIATIEYRIVNVVSVPPRFSLTNSGKTTGKFIANVPMIAVITSGT